MEIAFFAAIHKTDPWHSPNVIRRIAALPSAC